MRKALAWLRYLTILDRFIVVIVATLVVVALVLPLGRGAGGRVIVSHGDDVIYVASLDDDRTIDLQGPIGTTVLEIKDHKARVISSPCPNQICMRMGEIHQHGDVLACAPNELVMQIEDEHSKDQTHDFISR